MNMEHDDGQSALHARIATALGWTEVEVRSFSLLALRDIVRPTSQKLAHEIDCALKLSRYILR